MDTTTYFNNTNKSRFHQQRKSGDYRKTISPNNENSLRIREIAQQNVYIMFPNARDPLCGISQYSSSNTNNKTTSFKMTSKSTSHLPKINNTMTRDLFSKTNSTKASLTQSKSFNQTMLEIRDSNNTIVKPVITQKRSEINQIQGVFKDAKKKKQPSYSGLDNELDYDFPFHHIVNFVENHSHGFDERQNIDFHKHYQRMYMQNKFQIKKLRQEKKERILKIKDRIKKENEELENRRIQIKQLYQEHKSQNQESPKSKESNKDYIPLKVRKFIIQQNLKDLSDFNTLLNNYEEYHKNQNNNNNGMFQVSSTQTNQDNIKFNMNNEDQQYFQPKEGGLLYQLFQKHAQQQQKVNIVNDLNENVRERDIYENQKKDIKIVEDIFIEQIMFFIKKNGIQALSPIDYYNIKGIVMHRKRKYKQMKLELEDVIDIKRHIKYNLEGEKRRRCEKEEKEQAKFYITEEQCSTVRKSTIETRDQTYQQDSILNYKNSLSTSLGTERIAIQPKLLEFVPPMSFLPRLQDSHNLGKRSNQLNNDFYYNFKNNTSLDQNNINNDEQFENNNGQNSILQFSNLPIEDKSSTKIITDQPIISDQLNNPQNYTERSKESQDNDEADMNQLQYLMNLNNQTEHTEKDQEEVMRMKLQIIKLMMKDDKKSIMKNLTSRILNKIEKRREILLKQIENEDKKERLEELQQELEREIKKKNVQLLLLTHANSLKRVSHRLMYEYDQQSQYYRQLSNTASLALSDQQNMMNNQGDSPDLDLLPETYETIFDMIQDSSDDIVANFVINQMDKQGVLEKLFQHLKQQENTTGTIDMEKVKQFILALNNNIPQEEINNLEMKNGKIVGRINKKQEQLQQQKNNNLDANKMGQNDEIVEERPELEQQDEKEKMDTNHPNYYKFYQKNKPEKIQIRLKDKTSDENRNNRLGIQHKNSANFKQDQDLDDEDDDEENNSQFSKDRSQDSYKKNHPNKKNHHKKNVFNELNNSRLKSISQTGSPKSVQSNKESDSRSKQSSFQRDLLAQDSNARRELMLQLKGDELAKDVLLGDFTAEQQLEAQEQLRLQREEEQRKIKVLGQKLQFNGQEDDPEMVKLRELIEFSSQQKHNYSLKATFNKKKGFKVPQHKYLRSNSSEDKEQDSEKMSPKLKKTNSMDGKRQIKKVKDAQGNVSYVDEFGKIIEYYKGLSRKVLPSTLSLPSSKSFYEEIEIEVTDTSASDIQEFDENGNPKPKQKRTKKQKIVVKRNADGQIIESENDKQLPKGMKINSEGKLVRVVQHVLEDGRVIELETEVANVSLKKMLKDSSGNYVDHTLELSQQQLKKKGKKKIIKLMQNGKEIEIEVTVNDGDNNISFDTDKMSVSDIEEDINNPLTPTTKQKLINQKKKDKKKKILLENGILQKKKVIKKIIKANGEIEEIITEVDDVDGGEEIQVYDEKGNLISKTYQPPNKEELKKDQKKQISQQIKKLNLSNKVNNSLLSATSGGNTTKKKGTKKKGEQQEEEWFNEDGTPWTSNKSKKNNQPTFDSNNNKDNNRNRQQSNTSKLSKGDKEPKQVEASPVAQPPQKIKRIIDGKEIEYMPLQSNESFHSSDIPSSLLDDSKSIKSADLSQMSDDKRKMYTKIKKKREEVKQKKIRDQLEKDIKDFRKNNVFTELEELMKQNLSLRELKRQIEVYLEMIKGKNIDDETKYNIFLYLQRKEQLVAFLIAFEDNFESNIVVKPEVMQEIRSFLKKRHQLVKAENEKRMKFTRPIVMPDGNGLSLFEEFKGDNISEWEIHQIMKYASYNQDVRMILDRLRQFKEDSNALYQIKLLLKKFECRVIQTDLDYLHQQQLQQQSDDGDQENGDHDNESHNHHLLDKNKSNKNKNNQLDENDKQNNQIDSFNNKVNALRNYKKKFPDKFQGLFNQFQTVKYDQNIFKALKNDLAIKTEKAQNHTARVTQAMWTNRMKQFNQTKVSFASLLNFNKNNNII